MFTENVTINHRCVIGNNTVIRDSVVFDVTVNDDYYPSEKSTLLQKYRRMFKKKIPKKKIILEPYTIFSLVSNPIYPVI